MPRIFPKPGIENVAIGVLGRGATHEFCTLITGTLPDLEMVSKAQWFPLYTYEEAKGSPGLLGNRESGGQSGQYVGGGL